MLSEFDLRDLTADLLADLCVAADDLNDTTLFNAQLDRNSRAAIVADGAVDDQLAVGRVDHRAEGDLTVGPCHRIARVARDAALDDRLHVVHLHVEIRAGWRGDVRHLVSAPNRLQLAVSVDRLIVSQRTAAGEVVNAAQADGDLAQLLLIDQLLEVVVVDGAPEPVVMPTKTVHASMPNSRDLGKMVA